MEGQYIGTKEISNYVAVPFVEGEEGGDEGDDEGGADEPIVGVTVADLVGTTWAEQFTDFSGTHSGTLTISATDNQDQGQLKVMMLSYSTSSSYYLESYADLNADGTELTVKCNGLTYVGWGCSMNSNIILSITNGGTQLSLSGTASMQWGSLSAYTATKQ